MKGPRTVTINLRTKATADTVVDQKAEAQCWEDPARWEEVGSQWLGAALQWGARGLPSRKGQSKCRGQVHSGWPESRAAGIQVREGWG